MSPRWCTLLSCYRANMRRKWSRSEPIDEGLGYFSYLQVMWHTSRTGSQPDCFFVLFLLILVFFGLILQPSSLTLQKDLSTERPAPQTEMNTSSASSISLLFVSLSLSLAKSIFFLFPWKLLDARLTTRAAVMTLDTRSRVDSALSTLAAFVAEPLGGTIGRALKKRRKKKRPRSCLRRNKSKIDFNSTIQTHWCFLFTGGPNRSCS